MALWQFTTIAALIGVLLVYVMVLTNRIGATNTLLKRIEEALVKPRQITENIRATVAVDGASVSAAAAEDPIVAAAFVPMAVPSRASVPSPTAEPGTESEACELADAPAVPARDRRVNLLTVRDLKVIARSGRRSSDSTVGMSPLFREEMERRRAEVRSRAESGEAPEEQTSDVEEPIVASAVAEEDRIASVVSDEVVEQNGEPLNLPASIQELATATYEIRDFVEAADLVATDDLVPASPEVVHPAPVPSEPASAEPVDEDVLERRRKRDAQLILSAQRRRRRIRGF